MQPQKPPVDRPAAPPDTCGDASRRRWMQALLLAPAAVAATGAPATARATIRTNAHVVIAGSGLGGIAIAARLGKLLDGAKITIVDAKEEHNYQPGYTLVATGVWRWWPASTLRPTA
jgi:sulfide:quinone oxidoreductase